MLGHLLYTDLVKRYPGYVHHFSVLRIGMFTDIPCLLLSSSSADTC
jgi:hypothetical protein